MGVSRARFRCRAQPPVHRQPRGHPSRARLQSGPARRPSPKHPRYLAVDRPGPASVRPRADRRTDSSDPPLPAVGAPPGPGFRWRGSRPRRRRRPRSRPVGLLFRTPGLRLLRRRASGRSGSSVPRRQAPRGRLPRWALPDRGENRPPPRRASGDGEAPPRRARVDSPPELRPPLRQGSPPLLHPTRDRVSRRQPPVPDRIRWRPLPARPGSRSGTGKNAIHG